MNNSGSIVNSQSNDSDDDPLTVMLKKTGCIDLHYKVQVSNNLSSMKIEDIFVHI